MAINKGMAMCVAAVAATLAVSACQEHVKISPIPQCDFRAVAGQGPATGPVLVPQIPGSATEMPLNAVNITDRAITNKIVVQSTNARREANGDITVFARFMNCTDFPLQVEGRTHFLDASQGDAEPVTAWTRLHLPSHGLVNYSTRSTAGSRVGSYLIEVREGG